MPEFEGTSETLSVQQALEEAVRKAYTASQRRSHTDPLFTYVVKRISGHLRTVTVVIETAHDDAPTEKSVATPELDAPAPAAARARTDGEATADPIRALLDKHARNETLTANEHALLELLRQPDRDR